MYGWLNVDWISRPLGAAYMWRSVALSRLQTSSKFVW